MRVRPNVPAKQYWAVTLYDLDTCCLIRDMSRPGIDSYDQKMTRNADGSVDLYSAKAAGRTRRELDGDGARPAVAHLVPVLRSGQAALRQDLAID